MPYSFHYTRYSTKMQEDSTLVKAYLEQMNRYYEYKLKPLNVEFGGEFVDQAISGQRKFCLRPMGAKILTLAKPGDHFVFARVDRAFRSTLDQLETVDSFLKTGFVCHFL